MIFEFNKNDVCINPIEDIVKADEYLYYAEVKVAEINGKWYRGGHIQYHNEGCGSPVTESFGPAYNTQKDAIKAGWKGHLALLERILGPNDKERKLYNLIKQKLEG